MSEHSIYVNGPDSSGHTVVDDGSGYLIGDGLVMTAGHVVYEFNDRSSVVDRAILHLPSESTLYDPRGYLSAYQSAALALGNPLPTPAPGHTLNRDLEGTLISKDIVFIAGSGTVGSSSAGLATFISAADMVAGTAGFLNGATFSRDAKVTHVVSGDITFVSGGLLHFSTASDYGDSGGAYLVHYNSHDYVVGDQSAQNLTTGEAYGNYLQYGEWQTLNHDLALGQAGNVTASEPSNMVVGSALADTIEGSFRADVLLGRDGADQISDGDGPLAMAWGNDTLIGGAGNDTLVAGAGTDVLWGGDKDSDQGVADGTDTADYSGSSSPVSISFDGTSPTPGLTVKDENGDTDTLHSIEKIIGTQDEDTFSFKGTIPVGYSLLIDSGGGDHDQIDLGQSTDSAGLKLYITNVSAGEGYIQSRGGGGGLIRVKNFHTDITGSDYSDIISDNSSGGHVIDAGAGDDQITVSGSGATIDGGAGNDVIHLKSDSAMVQFGAGGGHDVVEFDSGDGAYNVALQNLNPEDVDLISGGRFVYGSGPKHYRLQFIAIRIKATGETITFLENGKNIGPGGSTYDDVGGAKKLDSITFADGTIVHADQIEFGEIREQWGYAKDYANYDYMYHPEDYVGYVNATYLQADPIGALPPPPGEDLSGTSGDDNLNPSDGSDTVTGDGGDDIIQESRGNDTYIWNSGDGDDTIAGSDASDGLNTLRLGASITPANLQFAVANDGAGLTLSFATQPGSISLTDELVGDGYGVDRLLFADGTIMTRADLVAAASSVITAAQTSVNGTASADYLFTPRGNFVVDGGAGDDTVRVSGSGAGTFLFSSAGGHDEINEFGLGYSRNDTLKLTDVNPNGVILTRSGDALLVTVNATGATVNVKTQFEADDGNTHGISALAFADGTIWTRAHIHDLVYAGDTPPVAQAASASTIQDAAIIRGMLTASDPDAGDTLKFKLDDSVAGLVIGADGSWSFDPSDPAYAHLAQGQQLTLTANYHVTDAAGATSSSLLTLTVTGTEDMPLVVHDFANLKLLNNEAFLVDVTSHFMDPDGDPLTFTATMTDGSPLPDWLTFANGQFAGTAPADTSGIFDIVVTASDGTMAASSTVHIHFGLDQAPVAQALPDASGGINSPLDIAIPAGTFSDPDGDPVTLSATLADGTALPAWLSLNNGHLVGTPPGSAAGSYDIKIIASDGEMSASSAFSLTIAPYSIINGTAGADAFNLTAAFKVTGGLGDDYYTVTGDGSGIFSFSKGDGHDQLDQFDQGVRSDTLMLPDVNSDDLSVFRFYNSATFRVDDTGDTLTSFWQFYSDNGGFPHGFSQVQFADGVTWDRSEIFNRSATNEIVLDGSNPSTGTSASETFVIGSGLGQGVIDNFSATGSDHDYLQFDRSQFDDWAHLLGATVQQGSDLVINLDANDSVRLTGVSMSAFTSLDVRFVGSPA